MLERKPEFKDIKGYVTKELKNTSASIEDARPIILFDSLKREVIIKTFDPNLKGRKVYNIPLPQEREAFQNSWIEVFLGCCEYIKDRLEREGINVLEYENNIKINNKIYTVNTYEEYINILQSELDNYLKRPQIKDTPLVNKQSIKITPSETNNINSQKSRDINDLVTRRQLDELLKRKKESENENEIPKEQIKEEKLIKSQIGVPIEEKVSLNNPKLTATFPRGKYPIIKDTIKDVTYEEQNRYNMNDKTIVVPNNINTFEKPIPQNNKEKVDEAESQNISKKERKTTNYKELKKFQSRFCGAIIDDENLTLSDCSLLRDKPLVLITNTLSKNSEIVFYDNIELIKENIDIPIGAFITGKGTTNEKMLKEISKINNLCKNNITSGIICYEPNEELFKNKEEQEVLSAIQSVKTFVEALSQEYGYELMICIDLDTQAIINDNNINLNFPVLLRVSSKELENVNENNDVIIMHPEFDYDQLSLTDKTANYIQNVIYKNLQEQKASSKVA